MKFTGREALVFILVALAVLLGGLLLFGLLIGFGGMMGPGMMGPGMMGGMGLFWLLLFCLIPLLLILLAGGAIGLLLSRSQSRSSPQGENCPNCGRPVQPDWRLCPHCGQALQREPSG